MEEDEDRVLLSNLGVTSASVEDIERNLLEEAKSNAGAKSKDGVSDENNQLEKSADIDPSSAKESQLYNKLRAVQYEIDAVASTVHQSSNATSDENHDVVQCDGIEKGDREDVDHKNVLPPSANDVSLQQALAFDRLESLKKTKAQIEEELEGLCGHKPSKTVNYDKVIQQIVQDETKRKRKSKEPNKSDETLKKRRKKVSFDDDADFDTILDAASAGFFETERDELIRKGVLTPFHKLNGYERRLQQPAESSRSRASVEDECNDPVSVSIDRVAQSISEASKSRPTTKILDSNSLPKLDGPTHPFHRLRTPLKVNQSQKTIDKSKVSQKTKRPMPGKRWRKRISREEDSLEGSEDMEDDLVTSSYEDEKLDEVEDLDDYEPTHVTLEGGLRIPENIFSKLFDYQKVGVQWMWELHCQKTGGIIGDEMGLGKTIQVLSFLAALHHSNMYKPSIIVCPVTLMRQWKREARKWYPKFRVEILHDSARDAFNCKKRGRSSDSDYESEGSFDSDYEGNLTSKNKKWDSLIKNVLRSSSGLLITSYEQLRLLGEKLLDVKWGYAVLDEGHRIRNPNAEITLACKQLQTVHRIIMTGSPIQNKLTELWSLFDFVFPGKLGVLPVFEAEFAVPISVGGYANASPLQVSTAYRCAVVLRDLIMPYLLRRMKADVNTQLPKKTEHVLFCSLTEEQRSVYTSFLASSEVEQILDGSRNSLSGIDVMRKICNHPDLLEREHSHQNPDYGNPERSGKMKVVAQVLKAWKKQGHRALLFAQTQQMLDILEFFLIANEYSYRRMDGLTPVKQRMALIDEFNNSEEVFIFILTTKVGGLGTNLTGANRVILFDPDWNPSTDMQARERAWRIGQTREVTVYRLITRGTIEEKVYHRQIYKHFLTDKILKNPQQRRFFKSRELKDLFTFNDDEENGSTETSNIFSQFSEDVNIVGAENEEKDKYKCNSLKKPHGDVSDRANYLDSRPSMSKGKEKAEHGDDAVDEETNILKSLFDAQGIHSAMNHDAIMNAHDEEKIRLEEQALVVARRAAEALRQSRMHRSQDSISVPTWTGKSGSAGAPSSVSRKFGSTVNSQLSNIPKSLDESSSRNGGVKFSNSLSVGATAGKALSSAELLAKIRENQEKAVGAGLEQQFRMSSGSLNGARSINNRSSSSSQGSSCVQPEVLIRQICTFIQERGGSVTSTKMVNHFKDKIPSNDLPLFKNLLKEIATLQKESTGSRWVLKREYSQQ